jgi:hypothetical protein
MYIPELDIRTLSEQSLLLTQIIFAYFVSVTYYRLTTVFNAYHLLTHYLFLTIVLLILLTICFCCLHLPYIYRELLEPALINQSSHQ